MLTREETAAILGHTHLLSIWPLTEMGEFADSAPDYQSAPMSESEARADYLKLTYASAAALTPYEDPADWCPGYLVSLDVLDEGGDPVCCEAREVYAEAKSPATLPIQKQAS